MNLSVMLRTADGYLLAGKSLLATRKNALNFFKYYISPCAVNLAFACEIYLKYLYAVENPEKTIDKTHGLLDVYHQLRDETKKMIKCDDEKWTSVMHFDECIKNHNKTFIVFRYMYETDGISVEPQSLYNLAVALKNTCNKKQESHHEA